jgi:hypothetical protein
MEEFVAKLTAEKAKAKKCPEQVIDWIYEQGVTDDAFRSQFMQETKSLERLWDFVTKKAREQANGGNCACIDESTVYGWVREYLALDDAEEARKEADRKKAAKEAEEKRKAEIAAKKTEAPAAVPVIIPTKKIAGYVDGQIGFDLHFGGAGK